MPPKQRVEVSLPAWPAAASSADLHAFIHQMDNEGRLGEIMEVLGQAFGTTSTRATPQAPGIMTDASKRLRDTEAPDSDHDWGFETIPGSGRGYSSTTSPMPSTHVSGQAEPKGVDLPTGVDSLSKWGSTVCQLPKLASLNLSYSEIIDRARHDKEVKSYVETFVLRYQGTSARVHDLKRYLKAVSYGGDAICYDGSNELRIFKQ